MRNNGQNRKYSETETRLQFNRDLAPTNQYRLGIRHSASDALL